MMILSTARRPINTVQPVKPDEPFQRLNTTDPKDGPTCSPNNNAKCSAAVAPKHELVAHRHKFHEPLTNRNIGSPRSCQPGTTTAGHPPPGSILYTSVENNTAITDSHQRLRTEQSRAIQSALGQNGSDATKRHIVVYAASAIWPIGLTTNTLLNAR
jgi:hypothetical protein